MLASLMELLLNEKSGWVLSFYHATVDFDQPRRHLHKSPTNRTATDAVAVDDGKTEVRAGQVSLEINDREIVAPEVR